MHLVVSCFLKVSSEKIIMPLKMTNIDHPSDNECTLFFSFHRWKFALFTSANRNSYLQEEYKVIVNGGMG